MKYVRPCSRVSVANWAPGAHVPFYVPPDVRRAQPGQIPVPFPQAQAALAYQQAQPGHQGEGYQAHMRHQAQMRQHRRFPGDPGFHAHQQAVHVPQYWDFRQPGGAAGDGAGNEAQAPVVQQILDENERFQARVAQQIQRFDEHIQRLRERTLQAAQQGQARLDAQHNQARLDAQHNQAQPAAHAQQYPPDALAGLPGFAALRPAARQAMQKQNLARIERRAALRHARENNNGNGNNNGNNIHENPYLALAAALGRPRRAPAGEHHVPEYNQPHAAVVQNHQPAVQNQPAEWNQPAAAQNYQPAMQYQQPEVQYHQPEVQNQQQQPAARHEPAPIQPAAAAAANPRAVDAFGYPLPFGSADPPAFPMLFGHQYQQEYQDFYYPPGGGGQGA